MASSNFKEIAKQTGEKFSLLNATKVFPGLWIGSMYAASDEEFLINNNIKYILTVTEDGQESENNNNLINHIYVPMRDEVNFNALKLFPKTCQFIDDALQPRFQQAKKELISKETTDENINKEEFDNILVHCQLGISRSATIVCAFLLYKFYEYNTPTDDNVDIRRILKHLLENDSPSKKSNSSTNKSKATSTIDLPFDQVSSVIKYLQRKRPTIKPNAGFERQLQLWQSKLEHNYEKEYNRDLKKSNISLNSSPTSPIQKRKNENRLSSSLEYLKIYSISKCSDLRYKYLTKKKSINKNDSNGHSSKVSKEEVAKKLNL
ncbi:phosphatases II [Neocallimastix lanati (nom. inval.)]|nr:phosphatases II [Neocallimastix sp. JGI-2020a]